MKTRENNIKKNSTSTSSEMTTQAQIQYPSIPTLYFHEKDNHLKNTRTLKSAASSLSSLPSELITNCLTTYADWGDLAKLACVQSSWRHIVHDSAHFGGRDAKWHLIQALLEGTNGLSRNSKLAVQYLLELTDDDEEPFAPAMQTLATCYLNGDGVEPNTQEGITWLEKASYSVNDSNAAYKLAQIYEYGEYGTDVDVVLAANWFRHAAEGKHLEAMVEYAMCCELGCGTEQSDEQALEWYIKAANEGHIEANFSVGEAFEEAKGVPQSDEEACLWYYKAAIMGDEDAKQALRRLRDIARIILPSRWVAVLNE